MSGDVKLEDLAVCKLFINGKQTNNPKFVAFIGLLSTYEAKKGCPNSARVAYKCYVELSKADLDIPSGLKAFVLENLQLLAEGVRPDKALCLEGRIQRPAKFDGFDYAQRVIEAWSVSESQLSIKKFEAGFRKAELVRLSGVVDESTIRRSFDNNYKEALRFLELKHSLF